LAASEEILYGSVFSAFFAGKLPRALRVENRVKNRRARAEMAREMQPRRSQRFFWVMGSRQSVAASCATDTGGGEKQ
jgi:hypothetical protein